MNITSICAAAIVAAIGALYLKQVRGEYASLVTLAAVVFIMSGVIPYIILVVEDMTRFANESGVSEKYITPILKIIGIAYIAEIASDICADSGEKAIASHVETAGKVAVAALALPMVEDVFVVILSLLR